MPLVASNKTVHHPVCTHAKATEMRRAEQPHPSERWRVETGEPLQELAVPKDEPRPGGACPQCVSGTLDYDGTLNCVSPKIIDPVPWGRKETSWHE